MKKVKFSLVLFFFILVNIGCTKQSYYPTTKLDPKIITIDTIIISKNNNQSTKGYDYYHELMTYDAASGTWFASWGESYTNNTRLTFSGPAPDDIDPWEQPYFDLIEVQNGSSSWIGNNSWSITYYVGQIGSTNIPVKTEQQSIHKWENGQEIIYDILIHYRTTVNYPSFSNYTSSFKIYKLSGEYYLVNTDFVPPTPFTEV